VGRASSVEVVPRADVGDRLIGLPEVLRGLGIHSQRRGHRLVAHCPHPDHADRSPSWAIWVHDDGSIRHKCLSCGWGGGVGRLVMTVLGCTWEEAREWLRGAEVAGPGTPLEAEVEIRGVKDPVDAASTPFGVEHAPLADWPTPARRYLEDRAITPEQVDRFGIGFAVGGDLIGRVWIPVRDRELRLLAWTARAFDGRPPKYREPGADVKIDPGALMGQQEWPAEPDIVVVVEGPFDGLAIDSLGMSFAVLRGSDMHPLKASRLARFPIVIVATDADAAGDKAAALVSGIGRWSAVVRADLQPGVDPAELRVRDASALRSIIMEAARRGLRLVRDR